jgi:hypothetical protein
VRSTASTISLMRQKGDQEDALHQTERKIAIHSAQVILHRRRAATRDEAGDGRQQGRQGYGQDDECCPNLGRDGRLQPSKDQGEKRRRRR